MMQEIRKLSILCQNTTSNVWMSQQNWGICILCIALSNNVSLINVHWRMQLLLMFNRSSHRRTLDPFRERRGLWRPGQCSCRLAASSCSDWSWWGPPCWWPLGPSARWCHGLPVQNISLQYPQHSSQTLAILTGLSTLVSIIKSNSFSITSPSTVRSGSLVSSLNSSAGIGG